MQTDKSLVYIVIVNYNRRDDTRECLDSLKNLEYQNYRIILLDNGSTDGSNEVIRKEFPEVELIENHKNLGFSQASNIGIKRALEKGADFILTLNNDTVVSGSLLGDLLRVAAQDETIGILGPKILYYQKKDRIWFAGGGISLFLGNTWHKGQRCQDGENFKRIIQEDYQTGCCLLVKRELVEKVGVFDTGYVAYFEDADLCLRAKKAGFKVVCVQPAVIWHKVSKTSGGGLSPAKAYLKAKSGVRFFKRHSPKIFYNMSIPICVFFYILAVSIVERLKNNPGILRAFVKGLKDGIQADSVSP